MNLDRFVTAQDPVIDVILAELEAGQKRTHWMWFVFPVLRGIGRSDIAIRYALADIEEAADYTTHPVLAERLSTCGHLMLTHVDIGAAAVLGDTDAFKLRACATLFSRLPDPDPVFVDLLEAFHGGRPCRRTLALLNG